MKFRYDVTDGNEWRTEILDTDNIANDSGVELDIIMIEQYLRLVYGLNNIKNIEEV